MRLRSILPIFLGLALARAGLMPEQRQQASEFMKQYHAAANDQEKRAEILQEIIKLGPEAAEILLKHLDQTWEQNLARYANGFRTEAKLVGDKKRGRFDAATSKEARKSLLALSKLPDPAMKKALAMDGVKWLSTLKKSTQLSPAEVLKNAPLKEQRRQLDLLRRERNRLVREAKNPAFAELANEVVEEIESKDTDGTLAVDKAKRLTEANAKAGKDILPQEFACVEDLNFLRVILGLEPLFIDLKLCQAARGHSTDMVALGFFAHDSPVKGKENPFKRAQAAGTTAGSENIAMGTNGAKEANHLWFLSPGHHRNMFGPWRRVGVGYHRGHWTQLFGG